MSLNIVLTNDDSYTAPGIATLYGALVAAGHNVHIVAPLDPQSAQGTSLGGVDALTSTFVVDEYEPGNYNVDGTVIPTVLTGLELNDLGAIFPGDNIDVVISGTNKGENIGDSENISGTVNGSLRALYEGIPSIAVSAESSHNVDLAYQRAGEFTVEVLDHLEAARADGAPLLPAGTGLSINVPDADEVTGVAMTVIDDEASASYPIVPSDKDVTPSVDIPGAEDPQVFTSAFIPGGASSGNAISEGAQFLLDRITVSALDGNWYASEAERATLEDRLDGVLNEQQDSDTSLDIMLVDGDGFDAPGLEALRNDLLAAGHTVHVVAPLENESYIGSALTLGTWTSQEYQPGDFAVDATPDTTVSTGIEQLLADTDVDLVVSGIGIGASTGITANTSSTLAAAVEALFNYDVPSIAVSAGTDELGTTTEETLDFAAKFTTEVIDSLLATAPADGSILPAGVGLNINVPIDASTDKVAFTAPDAATQLDLGVEPVPVPGVEDTLRFAFDGPTTTDNPHSEGTNFAEGYITISPIDGNYNADLGSTLAVAELLGLEFGNPTVFTDGEPDLLLA